jgi:uncharacterized protein
LRGTHEKYPINGSRDPSAFSRPGFSPPSTDPARSRSHFVMTKIRICSIVYTDAIELGRAEERSNQRKHGISFDTASRVFLDPLHLSRQDRIVEGEERWQTIGMVNGVLLILVAYTVVDEKEEVLRIISARRVTRQERIEYEEASQI